MPFHFYSFALKSLFYYEAGQKAVVSCVFDAAFLMLRTLLLQLMLRLPLCCAAAAARNTAGELLVVVRTGRTQVRMRRLREAIRFKLHLLDFVYLKKLLQLMATS